MATESNDPQPNPLLGDGTLPKFSAIAPSHVAPALEHVLSQQRAAIEKLESAGTPDVLWLQALERVYESINRVWSPVGHLNAVLSSPELRDAYNACLPLLTEFYTDLGQNRSLYERFVALSESAAMKEPTVARIVELGLRDFKLAGVALTGEPRERFKEIMKRLASLQATFEQNVMDATDAFEYHEVDSAQLGGIPVIAMERAAAAAREKNIEGWLFRLDPPTYVAVIGHADNVQMRAKYYEAWSTRASDQGPDAGRWDNGPLIEEILALRLEAAHILGFETFSEQSLATKMADSPEHVIEFLRDLAKRSKSLAESELAELASLAGRDVAPWDVPYYSEKLKQKQLDISEEELRPYFPLDRVLSGLFGLAHRLFGIRLVPVADVDTWHDSVTYYRLENDDGSEVGGLFVDFFARPNKRGGAWMDVCVNRSRLGNESRAPVAHLVCNFSPAVGNTPSQLTHSDVVTLFHEFGHSLHHLLTEVDYPSIAGINGVAWDAVELPSQFLENYAFLPEVLRGMSSHYETGESLPDEKIFKIQKSRVFLAGIAMVRQLEFALFDFLLHSEHDPVTLVEMRALLERVRGEVAVIKPPAFNRFPNSFSHIFGGGYAAGYYSYKWAEVLAADAFAAFRERGAFDAETARRFRKCILAVGGSLDALDAFVAFRGRQPDIEPLLRQSGIIEDAASAA